MQQKISENVAYALFGQWAAGENQKLPLAQVKPIEGQSKFTMLDADQGIPLTYTTDPQNGTVTINLPTAQPIGTFIIWAIRMESVQPV